MISSRTLGPAVAVRAIVGTLNIYMQDSERTTLLGNTKSLTDLREFMAKDANFTVILPKVVPLTNGEECSENTNQNSSQC